MAKTKEETKEYQRQYRENHKEERKKSQKEWFAKNPDKRKEYQHKWYLKNKEKTRIAGDRWRKENPEKAKEIQKRSRMRHAVKIKDRYFKKTYGISMDDAKEILKQQNHKCAICGTDMEELRPDLVHVDHCHTTGKVRGVLCNKCNCGLGAFRDNINSLNNAIAYLQS